MSKREDSGFGSFLVGLLTGAAAGAVFGILFAPKTGEEFRDDIQERAKRLPGDIKSSNESAKGLIDRTRYNIENQVSEVKNRRDADRMAKAKRAEEIASGGYDLN